MSEEKTTKLRDGWRMARVGDILKVRNGYAFKSTDYQPEGVPLVRQSDLGDDVVDITGAKRVDAHFLGELPSFVVRDGDLLIGMSGSLGKIARYQHTEPALQNQRTGLLQVKPEHEAKFAKLVLKFVEPQILAEGKGIAVQNVSAKEIEDCTFPLPSLDEQRRIVAEIEKQFTRLEAGVAALRRVQSNLKRYRAAVLKAACEGRLVPTQAELQKSGVRGPKAKAKYETGAELLDRILAERRQNWQGRGKYKEPAAPDTANLPPIPDGWTWAALEAVSEAVGGFAFSSTKFVESGYQVVKMANIRMGKIDLTQRPSFISDVAPDIVDKYSLREGDLVVTLTGTRKKRDYGYVAVVKTEQGLLLNQRIARVRPFAGMDSNHSHQIWLPH